MKRRSISLWIFVASVIGLPARPAFPQAARGTLNVTIVDQSGAVIAGATVIVAGTEDATKAATALIPGPVQTSSQGIATVTGLAPGRYSVEGSFPGFETRLVKDVRIRAGENRQVLLLPIAGLKDAVSVEQRQQEANVDPRGPSFGTVLTREQLEALSDDPDVLRQQLQDMAGPGAVIRVDSFEGGALPPKAQIRSIRISRDQFAAENHGAGGTFIEIITQPGLGPIRYNSGFRFRGGSMSGRSPFTPTKGPEQIRNYNLGLGGTLVKDKSSFNLFVGGMDSYDTPVINAALVGGIRSEALRLRTPRDNINIFSQADYALTLDQTLRFGYNMFRTTNGNLGIGAYDTEERAFSTENQNHAFRVQHMGPLGRRAFTRTRLQYAWSTSQSRSVVEQPTIRVNDAFTSGGAQVAGGQHTWGVNFGSDLDYVRGLHSFRTGVSLDAARVRSDDATNYLGTYTFESLDAYMAGRPRSYTRRIGDPNISFASLLGALYVQDDVRVRRNLTLSAGLRYEAETHVRDYDNVGPRFGVTWSPFASGATTLRSSWGVFYDWLQNNTYEQTVRVDGFRQQELDIRNPSFPIPADFGSAPPANRYLLADGLRLPRNTRVSAGIDQRLASRLQSTVTYSYTRGSTVLRGLNLNAPVGPVGNVRPEPQFGNVIAVASDARSHQHQLQVNLTANPGALVPAFNAPRINFKRTTLFFNYALAKLENNTDGAFGVPSTGDLALEWGPGAGDVRHRINIQFNNQVVRNLLVSFNVNMNSGSPYTIRTGHDDNGDLIFNDRPAGVGRNTERAPWQWTINPAVQYSWGFGRRPNVLPPGVTVIAGGGVPTIQNFQQDPTRYRLQVFVQVQNLTNRPNYVGYSGTLTSPFFGQPTAVNGTRKVDVGMNLNF
ncbi:MAG TPA: TonB-dependent receptor [Vicinamibacterales bacterium]